MGRDSCVIHRGPAHDTVRCTIRQNTKKILFGFRTLRRAHPRWVYFRPSVLRPGLHGQRVFRERTSWGREWPEPRAGHDLAGKIAQEVLRSLMAAVLFSPGLAAARLRDPSPTSPCRSLSLRDARVLTAPDSRFWTRSGKGNRVVGVGAKEGRIHCSPRRLVPAFTSPGRVQPRGHTKIDAKARGALPTAGSRRI